MKNIILLLLLTVSTLTYSQTPEDEVVVRLNQEHALLDVYVADIEAKATTITSSYIQELNKTLSFDLDHTGMTKVLPDSSSAQSLTKNLRNGQALDTKKWKDLGAFYVIDPQVNGLSLTTYIYSITSGERFQSPTIQLSGEPEHDRREMHILADSIHKTLFGRPGIASTRVLYTVSSPGSTKERPLAEVWVADYDGHNAKQVTQENSLCVTPSFIPPAPGFRSGNFLYVSYRYGQPKIFVGSTTSQSVQRFSPVRGNQLMPQASSKRDQVAFICDAAGNPDIFLQSFSSTSQSIGKPRQVFAAPHATQASPVFSPDGSKLAFVSNKDGRPRIYVMNVPTGYTPTKASDPSLISKESYENTSPAWSPDGSKIAYSAKTNGIRQIWLYDYNTGKERQLTQGPGNKENPTWAPNSLHIMFNSADQDASELFLINLHEPTATKITSGPGRKRFPSWEPLQ